MDEKEAAYIRSLFKWEIKYRYPLMNSIKSWFSLSFSEIKRP
jgi:hypothetical protein